MFLYVCPFTCACAQWGRSPGGEEEHTPKMLTDLSGLSIASVSGGTDCFVALVSLQVRSRKYHVLVGQWKLVCHLCLGCFFFLLVSTESTEFVV